MEADSKGMLEGEKACAEIAKIMAKELRGFLSGDEAFARVRILLGGGCLYSFVNPVRSVSLGGARAHLSRPHGAREGASILGGRLLVWPGVPHDGVDDPEALSGDGLQRRVVSHLPRAALVVVAPEAVLRADERVAGEDQGRFFSGLFPPRCGLVDLTLVPDWLSAGAIPQ